MKHSITNHSNLKRTISMALACAVGLMWTGTAQAQVTLRYKFKEGEKLDYVMEQKMKMSQNIGGMNIQTDMNQNMDISWLVQSVDSQGTAAIKAVIGRMKMSMDTPMGKIEVDSDNKKEPDDPIGKALQPAIAAIGGLEMTYKMDATGQVSDLNIADKFLAKLKNLGGGPGMGDMFSADALKQMATQGLVFPKDAVEKGKSWTNKSNMKMPFGKMSVDTEYTYEGADEKSGATLQKLAVKPKVKLEADPNAQLAVKLKSSTGKGTLYFDNTAGRIMDMNQNQTMEMELEIAGQTITSTVDTNTLLKLKKSAR